MSFPRAIPIYAPQFVRDAIEADLDFPRGYYAHDVLHGDQLLSGADLRGRAKYYGVWYARQRGRVMSVARRYGLTVVYSVDAGRCAWSWTRPQLYFARTA